MSVAYVPVGDLFAIVDIEDLALVLDGNSWHKNTHTTKTGKAAPIYAARGWKIAGKRHREKMHQLICPNAEEVDHINGNGLDNRRSNLRPSTRMQNARNQGPKSNNKSGYRGVCWDKARGKWKAEIGKNNKNCFIGRYDTKEDAARAYDKAAKEWGGEFVKLNFPEEIK